MRLFSTAFRFFWYFRQIWVTSSYSISVMRRRLFFCLLAVFGLLTFSSSGLSKKNSRSFSYYHPRGDRSSLRLYDNGRFEQSRGNCTYYFTAKGTWFEDGDTIHLEHEKIKRGFGAHHYVDRSKKVFVHSADSMQYMWDKEFGLNLWLVFST